MKTWLLVLLVASLPACSGNLATHAAPGKSDDPAAPTTPSSPAAPAGSTCKVKADEDDGVLPTCEVRAAPKSFKPVIKWTWTDPEVVYVTDFESARGSAVTPLVGNFTDDNGDGAIDLCDTPDVLVTSMGGIPGWPGWIYLLAGDTGALEVTFSEQVDSNAIPAFGDLDGDGLPEVVAVSVKGNLLAFEHDGRLKWTGDHLGATEFAGCFALALYDLDGDGRVEIITQSQVFDDAGHRRWGVPGNFAEFPNRGCMAPTAADLDGDGKLEVIFGNSAYRADGQVYWTLPGPPGVPHVVNLDDDPEPEIFVARHDGYLIVEHDGKLVRGPERINTEAAAWHCWAKAGAFQDFDGDGRVEVGVGSCKQFALIDASKTGFVPRWTAAVSDLSGIAAATAFDFLGDGVAEAIYADEYKAFVFDGKTGEAVMTIPRPSGTAIDYPVVADVDNDGSADLIVVSQYWDWSGQLPPNGPTVTVYQDAQKRWVPTRRIWNQHAYHVTNVREDGTIPAHPARSWQRLNTFRTNSQLEKQGSCLPRID